jgi:hypothetical protein
MVQFREGDGENDPAGDGRCVENGRSLKSLLRKEESAVL